MELAEQLIREANNPTNDYVNSMRLADQLLNENEVRMEELKQITNEICEEVSQMKDEDCGMDNVETEGEEWKS